MIEGVDTSHPELAGRISGTANMCTPMLGGCEGTGITDTDGHGTHVAGLACAAGDNHVAMASIGFGCSIYAIKTDLSWTSIINSIYLEDGLERCEKVLPLAKEHGSAVIALTIDEKGMAKTAEDKVRIARRIYDICTRDFGLRPEDLLFDVLTFTICTGNEDDRRLGLETLEGIRRVRAELPGVGLFSASRTSRSA